jgi:hypothetical protein
MKPRTIAVAALLWAMFLGIYLPQAGHGFIQDDFRWILESKVNSIGGVVRLFSANVGFYRPVVSLSFAADYAVWNLHAFGYSLTNLAFCLLASALLYLLARRLGLSQFASLVVMALWLFNFHAVNMAVLWISGRTALLACVFSLLCAHAILRGRYLIAGVMALAAALAKEEAVMLPALFAIFIVASERRYSTALKTAPLWVAVAAYLLLRSQSGAFWPGNAPSFYQLSVAPDLLLRNVAEYADRAATVAFVVALAFAVASRIRWVDFTLDERRALLFGAIWVPAMFALTVFLPVRSSLYALLPSIGTTVAAGVVAAVAERRNRARFLRVATVLAVAIALLFPVYRARNRRWVEPAELSDQTTMTLVRDLHGTGPTHVQLIDDPAERFNFATAFGGLLSEALTLHLGDGWTGEVVTSVADTQLDARVYRLANGRIARVR